MDATAFSRFVRDAAVIVASALTLASAYGGGGFSLLGLLGGLLVVALGWLWVRGYRRYPHTMLGRQGAMLGGGLCGIALVASYGAGRPGLGALVILVVATVWRALEPFRPEPTIEPQQTNPSLAYTLGRMFAGPPAEPDEDHWEKPKSPLTPSGDSVPQPTSGASTVERSWATRRDIEQTEAGVEDTQPPAERDTVDSWNR